MRHAGRLGIGIGALGMAQGNTSLATRGLTDAEDRLISADVPLAELQERCGGTIPGVLAVPELLDLVRQGRVMGLRLAREFSAFDGQGKVSGFVRINPLSGEENDAVCEILVENWHRDASTPEEEREAVARIDAIDRATAELTARLNADQNVQAVECNARDLSQLAQVMRAAPGSLWYTHVELPEIAHRQPLHWRLLDGAQCVVGGSQRSWRARLLPIGGSGSTPIGFELLLVADHPLPFADEDDRGEAESISLVGDALTPALGQPISRIIANAETIKAKLAGPLRPEYSGYAGDIATAGQHLADLLDDLADLEVVESEDFSTAREKVDLADAARRAAGILGVKARDKSITLNMPDEGEAVVAMAEFRRAIQILLNLMGNAINYSPAESSVTVSACEVGEGFVGLLIADNGPGMSAEQQLRVFDKFERLGRDGDGGSGLGLYISQRLAHAMGGSLTLESAPGEGARFTLALPAAS